jgi:hypothetical protein
MKRIDHMQQPREDWREGGHDGHDRVGHDGRLPALHL